METDLTQNTDLPFTGGAFLLFYARLCAVLKILVLENNSENSPFVKIRDIEDGGIHSYKALILIFQFPREYVYPR